MRWCPACHVELEPRPLGPTAVEACPLCDGVLCEAGALDAVAGRPVRGVSDPIPPEPALPCPGCATAMAAMELGASRWHGCPECGAAWLDRRAFGALTGKRLEDAPATRADHVAGTVAPPTAGGAPITPVADRLPFDRPLVQRLAYPVAAAVALLVGGLGVGETLFLFARIWIHELGHAFPAWLSGRAALPLPFGFTFWNEESSAFTALCLAFLIGVFAVASYREKRRFGMVLAGVLFALQIACTLVVSDLRMIEWILAGGLAGELVLSTLLVVSFYYLLPDRFRWDFWRFVVLVPAACVFASAFAMWIRIDQGSEHLPFGSILGAPGDGTGDVERLMDDYYWTAEGMTTFYRTLGFVCLLVIVAHYVAFGLRSLGSRLAAGDTGRPPDR
ncbi:MAG: zf-TFIIB domain-containing protein [Myxococcales bacterium]|nr:zf-TFIIB domain-containing protein [Myxococcales bacterium]